MKAPKKLSKPENWQDFESLCKKLWWEIWKCEEIKKNWRQWQNQSWVDVYWVPKNEIEYYWIQCKWKDDYINSRLNEKEIDEEIEKAKNFKPKLKKYYFATTGNKDVEIEEYVRKKNLENIHIWLFEIHLFSWEDIVDLINENPNTYRYYVESINFKDEYDVELVFNNWTNTIDVELYFSEKTKKYIYKEPVKTIYRSSDLSSIVKSFQLNHPYFWWENRWENMSWWTTGLVLRNKWTKQLENYKIYLDFSWSIEILEKVRNYLYTSPLREYDIFLYNESKQWTLKPIHNKPLVPRDAYYFGDIDFKPSIGWWKIYIDWTLVSSHFSKKWRLEINTITNIVKEDENIEVKNMEEVREETSIEDFYRKSNSINETGFDEN